jgi:hypothetical protein
MTLTLRHIILLLLPVLLAVEPARAEFDLMNAKPADKVAASKFFTIDSDRVSTFETTNLSLPVSTSASSILYVESTQKATAVQPSVVMPRDFELSQNFPNPFNNSTKILYSIPVHSNVSLVVYDVTGREVATLVHGAVEAGAHAVNFDVNNMSSGTYYYRMIATGQSGMASVETKKMIVMK